MSNAILSATSAPFHPGTPWELFRFETPEAGAPAATAPVEAPAVSGTPDPEVGADPSVPSAAAPEPAAPTWGPDSPEFQIALDQAVAQRLAGYQQQTQHDQGGYEPGFELDLFADDAGQQIAGMFGQMLNQALDQRLGPIQAAHVESIVERGTQESHATLESFADLGEFDRDEAFSRARAIYADYSATYGPHAARFTDRVLREAAEQQAAYERRIEARGVEAYKAQLAAAHGNGQGDPGVAGGAVRPQSREGESYDQVIARWEARQRAGAFQT